MNGIAKGIAHVSFPGGGLFVPARSAYDRQLLLDHVLDRVHSKRHVQVLVDDQRWLVHDLEDGCLTSAACCCCGAESTCIAVKGGGLPYCIRCAFADGAVARPSQGHSH